MKLIVNGLNYKMKLGAALSKKNFYVLDAILIQARRRQATGVLLTMINMY